MSWTTPRTWTTGEVVTAAMLNTDHRDNLGALSLHAHTGVAGDGAALVPPRFANDLRVGWTLPVPGVNPVVGGSAQGLELLTTTGLTYAAPAWDATPKWVYVDLSVTGVAAGAIAGLIGRSPVDLLPQFVAAVQHTGTLTTSVLRVGLMDTFTGAEPTNGLYLRSTNGGNWFAVARKAGVETATDTGVAASATAPKELRVLVDSATSVRFQIDGTTVRTETGANLPASGTILAPVLAVESTATGTRTLRTAQWFGVSHEVKSS